MPGDVRPEERATAVQALWNLVKKATPEALPVMVEVRKALTGPLGSYRERRRMALEEERRALAHRILDEGFPTNLPGSEFSKALGALEALLSSRPDASAGEIAAAALRPLQQDSRARRIRKQRVSDAARDVEDRWKTEVLMLHENQRAAIRSAPALAFKAMDQARIDYLKLLEGEGESGAGGLDLVRIVKEQLARLLEEVLPA